MKFVNAGLPGTRIISLKLYEWCWSGSRRSSLPTSL